MKLKPVKLAPALIAACVIVLVCLLRWWQPEFLERPEWMTYDMRVRQALRFAPPVATNLGFVEISDNTIDEISKGLLGRPYGLYWPRQVYGNLIRELSARQATAVGLDIIFSDRRIDHAPVPLLLSQSADAVEFESRLSAGNAPVTYENSGTNWMLMDSDDYFAWQLRRADNVILAADSGVQPNPLFATNTLAVADISAIRDADGVLRRVRAFQIYTNWHFLFRKVENDLSYGVNLQKARVEGTNIVLPRVGGLDPVLVPIDSNNFFELSDFIGNRIPPGWPARDRAFTTERIWHMGIVLAAQAFKLDLANADVDLARGRIILRGADGFQRTIPVDKDGYFYINWQIPYADPRVLKVPMEDLLRQDAARSAGTTNELANPWRGRLAVVGSKAIGNDLTDRGATPLEEDTYLATEHWNVANSILTNRFVCRSSLGTDLLLIAALGVLGAFLTWQLRVLVASGTVVLLAAGYLILSGVLYTQQRYWLPVVLPVGGALLLTHVCLVTWRVVFEQAEQRRVKSIFSTVVSPKIMAELLKAEKLSLGGARREVTVLFADVRGFTEFTDTSQEQAAEYVAARKLSREAAERHADEQARETLATVNLYLGVVAETILVHDATLDKFIGDCVMAVWGAPVPAPNHAVACLRAAIEAQRAISELNRQRAAENTGRETENRARVSAGLEPKPLLPLLLLGTGINTGPVTVGMMGSETKAGVLRQGNYTVFGREVNLASRLEGLSGRGRIFISESTYQHLLRDDPALAATCVSQPAQKVKGIGSAVKIYEVPWQTSPPDAPGPGPESAAGTVATSAAHGGGPD